MEVQPYFGTIKNSAEKPTAAGDVAMVFAFMKMLDPGSVVRESEFATAANTGGLGERVRAQINRAVEGTRLDNTVRRDFAETARDEMTSRRENYENSLDIAKSKVSFQDIDLGYVLPEDVSYDLYNDGKGGTIELDFGEIDPENEAVESPLEAAIRITTANSPTALAIGRAREQYPNDDETALRVASEELGYASILTKEDADMIQERFNHWLDVLEENR